MRLLYVEALGRLQGAAGMDALVTASLYDPDEEIRLSSLEQVVEHHYKPAVAKYVQALKNKDNAIVNRAAACLAQMKDPALDRTADRRAGDRAHLRDSKGAARPDLGHLRHAARAAAAADSPSAAAASKSSSRKSRIATCCQALVALTGGTSFNFDESAWKKWYAAQKQTQLARRAPRRRIAIDARAQRRPLCMAKPTVAILGASADRSKFGNKSVRAHAQAGYDVYPVNPKGGTIEG